MLRFGIIDQVDAAKGRVRVRFEEDDILSDWLPMMQSGTLKNKNYSMPDVNEHVVCLMDERAENGAVLGAVYNNQDTTPYTSANKFGTKYENGDEFSYDRAARKLLQKINTVEFSLESDGPTLKKGAETLKSILVELLDILIEHTHPTGTGPSGPPVQATNLTANKNKINNFFKA